MTIRAHGLTKRYGGKSAKTGKTVVDDLTFTVEPGTVTGFLGPNGAGKSTTMRMLLGLDTPTSGRATIGGRAYATHPAPLTEVGALLEAKAVHPGRTAFHHLTALALTHGIPRSRVETVLDLAGLTDVADKRVKGFSLGMGQRLGIAAALLGDPATIILDEPVNGLDPEGVLWIRTLLKSLAAQGRTVLVSSHLMSEMALTADHLVVIGRGRLLADTTVTDLVRESGAAYVKVTTPEATHLRTLLAAADSAAADSPVTDITLTDIAVTDGETPETLHVRGLEAPDIGRLAAANGLPLFELTPQTASLEQAFMDLTHDTVEYQATTKPAGAAA
ncbi:MULTISPECIES: ATP-binding cassette domain-containing protein [unclassified Streptomyces]|uniref:ATP-binding cassette domain-containing protein n=1 Tax=unclassified Streptomyces TaxID=2593676 RepID=UPI00278C651F|nr:MULTISPECIES: ATP-binding cassette domain-containing protein [unclassified Streptomyces]